MPIEVKNGVVVLDDATPEEMGRLRAAVRILVDWLRERAPLNDNEDATQVEEDNASPAEPQPVQLPME